MVLSVDMPRFRAKELVLRQVQECEAYELILRYVLGPWR